MSNVLPLDASVLPSGVRARYIDGINGLRVHMLEAGFESAGRPCVLLLHGFPELAYSWRKVMPALAAAGVPPACSRARLSRGRRGRPRFRRVGRRWVRADPARRVPQHGADERAVRGGVAGAKNNRRRPRRDGAAAATAQALSVVLLD